MLVQEIRPKGAIKDFIWTKENTLSKEFCDHVIKKFDADPNKKDGVVGAKIKRVDKKLKNTKDIFISSQSDWIEEDKIFYDSLNIGLQEYHDYLYDINKNCCRGFPNPIFGTSDTGYKVQKYEPNCFYDWHHDWSMTANPVASRIYTFMWYLNTIQIKDNGYTEFVDGTKIQPKAGTLIIFPATWTYLHRGYPPKVEKYLCNGWIHAAP